MTKTGKDYFRICEMYRIDNLEKYFAISNCVNDSCMEIVNFIVRHKEAQNIVKDKDL